MKYCCDGFRVAVVDGIISLPGTRVPHTDFLSIKHFIKKANEISDFWPFIYVEYCPSCGQRIGENNGK